MSGSFKTKYYTYNRNTPESKEVINENDNRLENALQKAMQSRKKLSWCKNCGSPLKYTGLGAYECSECKEEFLTDYGKVRKVMGIQKTMTISEICQETGLTKDDIKQLVDEGSIRVVNGTMLQIM